MITETLKEAGTLVAALLAFVLIAGAAFFFNGQEKRGTFPQEKYNSAYVWCESQPDVESCRWGAFNALSPALVK